MKSDKYTKCDIWAIGVLYYFMLFNKYPFAGPNMSVIYWNVCNKEIDFPSEISENSRDFISNCLKKEEIDRFSWDQLYKH
jgi:serine/threonine protein kinase